MAGATGAQAAGVTDIGVGTSAWFGLNLCGPMGNNRGLANLCPPAGSEFCDRRIIAGLKCGKRLRKQRANSHRRKRPRPIQLESAFAHEVSLLAGRPLQITQAETTFASKISFPSYQCRTLKICRDRGRRDSCVSTRRDGHGRWQ